MFGTSRTVATRRSSRASGSSALFKNLPRPSAHHSACVEMNVASMAWELYAIEQTLSPKFDFHTGRGHGLAGVLARRRPDLHRSIPKSQQVQRPALERLADRRVCTEP